MEKTNTKRATKKAQFVDKHYKLTKERAPLTYVLASRHSQRYPLLYWDSETGQNRELRYARNQKSPFVDEQDGNAILEPVMFEDGFLHVPKTNQVLQEFLHYHPMNGKSFVEVDAEKDASVEVETLMVEADAMAEAKKLNVSQLENVIRVVYGRDTSTTSTAELKRDVLIFAKQYPQDFLDVINDPELDLMGTIEKFFTEGLLTFRKSGKEVWYNTEKKKTKLLNVPFGKDASDLVVSYFKSDDGIEELKYLESLL